MNNLEAAIETEQKAMAAVAKAKGELAAATATLAEKRELWIGDPSKPRRDSKRSAEEDVELATERMARAQGHLEQRSLARAQAEKAAKEEQLATLERGIEGWAAAVTAATAKLLEIDAQLDAAVLQLAQQTLQAALDHDAAAALATELGRSRAFQQRFTRASLVNARLTIQRALAKARADGDRDDASAFLQSAPTDWKLADLSGEEIADNEARRAALGAHQ